MVNSEGGDDYDYGEGNDDDDNGDVAMMLQKTVIWRSFSHLSNNNMVVTLSLVSCAPLIVDRLILIKYPANAVSCAII